MIKDVLKRMLRRLLSYALGGLSAWLITHEIIAKNQWEWILIIVAGILVDLAWAGAQALIKRWHINLALLSTTIAEFKAVNDSTSTTEKVKEAISGKVEESPSV